MSGSITFATALRAAYDAHGRVDCTIGCTGNLEQGAWFDPKLDTENVREPETGKTLDVNLGGMVKFARASKHGILGLTRSTRAIIYECDGVHVNCICPGMTESAMTTNIIGRFRERGLHTQTGDDVAKFVVGLGVDKDMNGKLFTWKEFEDGYMRAMEGWLGEEPTRFLRENKKFVDEGGWSRISWVEEVLEEVMVRMREILSMD